MASLQSSCTLLSTNPNSRISPSLSAKPSSHLLPNARRSRRFQISCSSGEGKVDRRNMLLGLGGLYGAANLISDPNAANADPLLPPEFKSCGAAHDAATGDPLDANCCPPVAGDIIDYKIPPSRVLRRRPAVHKLTPEYLAKYEKAMRAMRKLDVTDPTDPRGFMQQANIHCAYCNGAHDQVGYPNLDIQIHNSWLFFPFHRWYLYFYERILGELIGDPTFGLPFWNWDNPKGMQMPKVFDNSNSPLFDTNRNQAHRFPNIVSLNRTDDSEDDLQKIANNLAVMYNEMVRIVNSTTDFMGQTYRAGDSPPGFGRGGSSERGSHTSIHAWVGDPRNKPYSEDMGNFYSAGRDPIFYSHHANVDRMWSIWKTLQTDVPKEITDPDYLNASFLFYDEHKRLVRVKVADALDDKKMGYEYEKVDIPWLNYKPSKKAARAKIQDLSKGAETAEKLFPLTLNKTVRVIVPKTAKGKVEEVLVLENVSTDPKKYIKFDVFVNDEDDKPLELDRAEYAGSFAQLPHKMRTERSVSPLSFNLKELYADIDIGDDDTIVVTIIPQTNGADVTIGGIKIVPPPPKAA